jgi:hypothetical protein
VGRITFSAIFIVAEVTVDSLPKQHPATASKQKSRFKMKRLLNISKYFV